MEEDPDGALDSMNEIPQFSRRFW